MTYEECCALVFIVQNRGKRISVSMIDDEIEYYAKNKASFQNSRIDSPELIRKYLIKKISSLAKDVSLIFEQDKHIVLRDDYHERLTPKVFYNIIVSCSKTEMFPPFFASCDEFYNYIFPSVFLKLKENNGLKSDGEKNILYEGLYWENSKLYYDLDRLLNWNDNCWLTMIEQCRKILSFVNNVHGLIDVFLERYRCEPVGDGYFCNGITNFHYLYRKFSSIKKEDYAHQMAWIIGYSFLKDNVPNGMSSPQKADEIFPIQKGFGFRHDFSLNFNKNKRSIPVIHK